MCVPIFFFKVGELMQLKWLSQCYKSMSFSFPYLVVCPRFWWLFNLFSKNNVAFHIKVKSKVFIFLECFFICLFCFFFLDRFCIYIDSSSWPCIPELCLSLLSKAVGIVLWQFRYKVLNLKWVLLNFHRPALHHLILSLLWNVSV